MAAKRTIYFKHHRSPKLRREFVRRQNAQLRALQHALSACGKPSSVAPTADLGIRISGASPVPLGANATYVATVKNYGPSAVSQLVVSGNSRDTLITFRSGVASQGSCSVGRGGPVCELGNLRSGASATVTFVATPGHLGFNVVEAAVQSGVVDPDRTNNVASLFLQVIASADLAVEAATSPETAFPGKRVTQSIAVQNRGATRAAEGVEVVDALSSGLEFLSASPSRGTCTSGATVRCDFGTLAQGERATVTIFAKALDAGTQTSSVSASSSTPDPNQVNNSVTLATTIIAPPTLPPASTGPACSPSVATTGNTTPYTEGSATDYNWFLRAQGTIHALMIFVDFPDANQSQSAQSLYDVLVPPAQQWYTEASYGRVTLAFDRVSTWFRMPKPSTQYGLTAGITGAAHHAYIADAIAAADPAVDFRGYDAVYIVPAAGAAIDASLAYNDLAGHGVLADGVEIRHAVTLDPNVSWPGVMVHETGHLFGLPDLYRFGVPYNPDGVAAVGFWDPMSGHSPTVAAQFLGWHKLKFGWLDPSQVRCLSAPGSSLEETLAPLESTGGVKLVVVPTGATTATVVEVRDPIGADTTLCDSGVLVYAVDGAVLTGQTPLRVRRAGAGTDSTLRTRCGTPYDAPLDLGSGETPVYEDSVIKVEVLATDGSSYRVRVAKK